MVKVASENGLMNKCGKNKIRRVKKTNPCAKNQKTPAEVKVVDSCATNVCKKEKPRKPAPKKDCCQVTLEPACRPPAATYENREPKLFDVSRIFY